jgi:hypothetical protein
MWCKRLTREDFRYASPLTGSRTVLNDSQPRRVRRPGQLKMPVAQLSERLHDVPACPARKAQALGYQISWRRQAVTTGRRGTEKHVAILRQVLGLDRGARSTKLERMSALSLAGGEETTTVKVAKRSPSFRAHASGRH